MGSPVYSDSSCNGDRSLYLGGARGRRVFYLDEGGWLRGVTYRHAWRDGENVAECFVTKRVNVMASNVSRWGTLAAYTAAGVVFDNDPSIPPTLMDGYQWDRCEGLDVECACGFYAYHNADTCYAMTGPGCRITAVIEAYGKVVLGTLGYRAQKARILAAVLPPVTEADRRRVVLEQQIIDLRNTLAAVKSNPRESVPHSTRRLAILTGLASALAVVVPRVLTPAFVLLAGALAANVYLARRAIAEEYKQTVESLESSLELLRENLAGLPDNYQAWVEKAVANYPNVQWFDSMTELLEVYPIESLESMVTPDE